MNDHDAQVEAVLAQVEAVLDVLAPKVLGLPPELTGALGVDYVRVPVIRFEYEDRMVMPTDEQIRSLAEQIVTAIRTVSGAGR